MFDDKWVIVYTACGNFAGHVKEEEGKKVTLAPAFGWINESVMVGPGQMGLVRQVMPMQATVQSSKLEIEYVGIQRIKDWPEPEQQEFMNSINKTIDGMQVSSAQKSGLVLPNMDTSSLKL